MAAKRPGLTQALGAAEVIREFDTVRLIRLSATVRPDHAVGTTGEPKVGDVAAVVFASPLLQSGDQALVLECLEQDGETRWLSEANASDVEIVQSGT